MIATLILEILHQETKLIVVRNVKETWDLTKILDIVNLELGARKACAVKTDENGKNGSDNYEGFPSTGSSLYKYFQYRSRNIFVTRVRNLLMLSVFFCSHGHWSDKCSLITDPWARKKFLKEKGSAFCLKSFHVSRNCSKKETCYYCEGMHNSVVCENKSK